jgi:D-cysteine desulfhydrase
VAELAQQLPELGGREVTLVCATGSGGTLAGLALGIDLLGLPGRVIGVNVCDDRAYFVGVVGGVLEDVARRHGLRAAEEAAERCGTLWDVLDGYVGRGYALSRPEELSLLRDACRAEGLVLDPVYTGKAMLGLVTELRRDPEALGEAVVFVHTGGIFGLLSAPVAAELAPLL